MRQRLILLLTTVLANLSVLLNVYLLFKLRPVTPPSTLHNITSESMKRSKNTKIHTSAATVQKDNDVAIFMNAYIPEDPSAAIRIVKEQITQINKSYVGSLENVTIHVTSIGNSDFRIHEICEKAKSVVRCVHDGHLHQGGETDTLSKLFDYCSDKPEYNQRVMYIHNKGSLHSSRSNTL